MRRETTWPFWSSFLIRNGEILSGLTNIEVPLLMTDCEQALGYKRSTAGYCHHCQSVPFAEHDEEA